MLTQTAPKLTYEGARAMMEAAAKKSKEMNVAMCIAVVDEGGHLLIFARIDDAKPSSVQVAITKATSAALRRAATGPSSSNGSPDVLLSLGLPLASEFKLTCVRGGLPIVWEGKVIGGIGISGGTQQQDEEVAQAGLTVMQ